MIPTNKQTKRFFPLALATYLMWCNYNLKASPYLPPVFKYTPSELKVFIQIAQESNPNKIIENNLKITKIGEIYTVEPLQKTGHLYTCSGTKEEFISNFAHLKYLETPNFEDSLIHLYGFIGSTPLQTSCFIGLEETRNLIMLGGNPYTYGPSGSALSLLCMRATDFCIETSWIKTISLIEAIIFDPQGNISPLFRNIIDQQLTNKELSKNYKYSVNLPSWSMDTYQTLTEDYESDCQKLVDESSKEEDPLKILQILSLGRKNIATKNNTYMKESFGKKRSLFHDSRTKITHQYLEYLIRRFPLIIKLLNISEDKKIELGRLPNFSCQIKGLLNGEEINLTQIHFQPHQHLNPLDRAIAPEKHKMHICPPPTTNSYDTLEKLFPTINITIEKCKELSKDPRNMAKKIDTIKDICSTHWWLCHLCLYQRGSASISNMFMFTLFQIAGLKPCGIKTGICIDLEALFQPQDSYLESFNSLFAISPERWETNS
jgi:hypothetical protein